MAHTYTYQYLWDVQLELALVVAEKVVAADLKKKQELKRALFLHNTFIPADVAFHDVGLIADLIGSGTWGDCLDTFVAGLGHLNNKLALIYQPVTSKIL